MPIRRMLFGLALVAILAPTVQGAALRAIRLGFGDQKTRLVFELDKAVSYQVQSDDSTVSLRFPTLEVPAAVLAGARNDLGGLVRAIDQRTGAEETTFRLAVPEPFYLRHFDLADPARVVIDVYRRVDDAPAEPPPGTLAGLDDPVDTTALRPDPLDSALVPALTPPETPGTETTKVDLTEPEPDDSLAGVAGDFRAGGLPGGLLLALAGVIVLTVAIVFLNLRRARRIRRISMDDPELPTVSRDDPAFQAILEEERRRLTPAEEESLLTEAPAESAPAEEVPEIPVAPAVSTAAPEPSVQEETRPTPARVPPQEVYAELSAEDGRLVWPVHILDGGRVGRILTVDDDPEIVEILRAFLQGEGYEVLALSSSREAAKKARDWRPDLLITGLAMPDMTGVDLVREIRRDLVWRKVMFLGGAGDRQKVESAFGDEMRSGQFELHRKPPDLEDFRQRIKDYFTAAQDVLHLNLLDAREFEKAIEPLSPHQLVSLHRFVWDQIFEVSSTLLGRRIEPVFITDRLEPADHYMRRMGCQQRRDYCIATQCIVSNPSCAANRLRAELEIMRQILQEFREEYAGRLNRGVGAEDLSPPKKRKREPKRAPEPEPVIEGVTVSGEDLEEPASPPPRRTLRRLVNNRTR